MNKNENRDVKKETEDEDIVYASQWELIWLKFKKHRLAIISGLFILFLYLVTIFAGFFAPYDAVTRHSGKALAPPQGLNFVDEEGNLHLRPFVYGLKRKLDPETFERYFVDDKSVKYYLRFLIRDKEYKLAGLFKTDLHLFGTGEEGEVFILGTDKFGRDLLSQIIYGSRISLSIGLLGVFVSFILGIIIGSISGYYGGTVDNVIQRFIEILRSFPTLPLWMALSASLPIHWPVIKVYFAITVILSVLGWTGMARVVRGKFLSLREEDFVVAAEISGASKRRIMFRHMLPSFLSHIIASATLSIPAMILGETALSFLGLGLRRPAVSWGVLLQAAQNVQAVSMTPWLLISGVPVIVTVLAFNFFGDGLRDAADPYQ